MEYSAEDVNQLYQMREFLERQAALLIPLPIDDEQYAALRFISDEHASAIAAADMQACGCG